ncbi:MAG TPA: transketolase C-terminal domain-containing protein [Armatimonadota bacterium]|jgi:transketolase
MQLGKPTREAYGEALAALGAEMPEMVVLDADLSKATMSKKFAEKFPERFFNMGICEANMVGVASGLASCGKIPFASSFASFLICKGFDQLRMSVAYQGENAKFCGTHSGVSIGEDGVSQQGIEDVALACTLNGFVVLVPCDEHEMRAAVKAAAKHQGPVYIRAGRPKAPIIYSEAKQFVIGKADMLRDGTDVTLMAMGLMVGPSLEAAEALAAEGISARVLNMASVKPLDVDAVVKAAKETGAIVVSEDHIQTGGLGAMVATTLAANAPAPMEFVNVGDRYAESGTSEALIAKYGLTSKEVIAAAKRVIARK